MVDELIEELIRRKAEQTKAMENPTTDQSKTDRPPEGEDVKDFMYEERDDAHGWR